jgi:putative DNA primase/helicase
MSSALDRARERTRDIKRRAEGQWDRILMALCPQIADAIARPGRKITCPFHGGKNDFRVDRKVAETGKCYCTCFSTGHGGGASKDPISMIEWVNGWDFKTAIDQIESVIGPSFSASNLPERHAPAPAAPKDHSKEDDRIIAKIRKWWSETVPLDHPSAWPVLLYLRDRWLTPFRMPLPEIGFHPALEYWDGDGKLVGTFPAIISIVRMLDGRVSTVHRTWITHDGQKAPVEEPRKQFSSPSYLPCMGAAIRLDAPIGPVLHIAEGLETALAVRALVNGQPVWSCLNKELMRGVHIPAHVRFVMVWADRDASYGGQVAARDAMDRFIKEGRRSVAFIPQFEIQEGKKSMDWNDVIGIMAHREATSMAGDLNIHPEEAVRRLREQRPGAGIVNARLHFDVRKALAQLEAALKDLAIQDAERARAAG